MKLMTLLLLIWSVFFYHPDAVRAEQTRIIAFSLREAQRATANPMAANAGELKFAGGMTEVIGFIINEKTKDIILLGSKSEALNSFSLDDLVSLMRCAQAGGLSGPGVSLEPAKGKGPRELLDVVFFGGAAATSVGQACFEADYLMKKIALEELPFNISGIRSYAALTKEQFQAKGIDTWNVLSRFWFTPIFIPIMRNEEGDTFLLRETKIGVCVQTISAQINGKSAAADFRDAPAEKFAEEFTWLYDEAAKEQPAFANLTRFAGAAKIMTILLSQAKPEAMDFWLNKYKSAPVKIPAAVPLLQKTSTSGQRQLTLLGGVRLAGLTLQLQKGEITAIRDAVLLARPSAQSISWSVGFDKDWRVLVPSATEKDKAIARLFADGLIQHEKGDDAGAIKFFDEALKSYPDVAEAEFMKAVCGRDLAVKQGRPEAALAPFASLSQLVKDKPQFIEARYELGETLRILGRTDEAIAEFKKANTIQPNYGLAYYGLGLALKEKGDFAGAIAAAEVFVKLADSPEQKEKAAELTAKLKIEDNTRQEKTPGNFKDYSDAQHKFICKYPSDWLVLTRQQLIERSQGGFNAPEDLAIAFVSPGNADDNVNIQAFSADEEALSGTEIEEAVKELDKAYPKTCPDFKKIRAGSLAVNGIKGFEYIFISTRLGVVLQERTATFVKSKKAFTITCTALRDDFGELDKEYFQPILESFNVQ